MIDPIAWTGGTPPRPWGLVARTPEGRYAEKLYREQVKVWLDHWGEVVLPRDVHAIFWGRARHDAHATFRERIRL